MSLRDPGRFSRSGALCLRFPFYGRGGQGVSVRVASRSCANATPFPRSKLIKPLYYGGVRLSLNLAFHFEAFLPIAGP